MKSIFTTVFALFAFVASNAQSVRDNVDLTPLLFRTFVPGKVILNNGTEESGSFNYNTDNQSLIFVDNGEFLALAGLENIKKIVLGSTVFVPVKNKIYQTTSKEGLYISYSNKTVVKKVTTDKSGTHVKNSEEVSNDVSNVYLGRNYKSRDGVEFIKNFWVVKGDDLIPVSSSKQLSKFYNVDKDLVNGFVTRNKTNFNNEADVLSLLDYIASNKQ